MKAFLETFRPVPGYEGLYEVSDFGTVRSLNYLRTGKRSELKSGKNKDGYEAVILSRDGVKKRFTVHKLIWEAFNGEIPNGMELDHINTVRDDNRLFNLRCVTPKENCNNPITRNRILEAAKRRSECPKWQATHRRGVRKACARPVLQIDKVTGEVLREWECARDVERELRIHNSSVSKCCSGKLKSAGGYRWRYANDNK